MYTTETWNTVLYPSSIGLVGASEEGFYSANIYDNLRAGGFEGKIVAINPKRKTVFGERSYASLVDAPPVDVAISVVARDHVEGVLDDAIQSGCGGLIVGAAGFRETADPYWVQAEERLARRAQESGTLLIGPNCIGLVSAPGNAIMTTSPYPFQLRQGGVALVMQSGGTVAGSAKFLTHYGRGIRWLFSIGNAAAVGFADVLEFLAEDEALTSIVMLVEDLRDFDRIRAAVGSLRQRDVSVCAVQIGRTVQARRAAMAHTGALARPGRVLSDVLSQAGIIESQHLGDALSAAAIRDSLGVSSEARAGRLGFIGVSGGTAGLSTDLALEAGLTIPDVGAEVAEKLADLGVSQPYNPLDVVGAMDSESKFEAIVDAFMSEGNFDAVVYAPSHGLPAPSAAGHRALAQTMVDSAARLGQRLIVTQLMTNPVTEDHIASFSRVSTSLVLPQAREAFAGLWLWSHGKALPTPEADSGESGFLPSEDVDVRLTELEIKALLQAGGCTVPRGEVLDLVALDGSLELSVSPDLRFPVALKGISKQVVHKARAGLVSLDIENQVELGTRAGQMTAAAEARSIVVSSLLVEEMVPKGDDLILSIFADPLGDILMVGRAQDGGQPKIAFRVLPLSADEVVALLSAVGIVRRGVELEVSNIVLALWDIYKQEGLKVIEVNPVRILAGGQMVVLDAVGL